MKYFLGDLQTHTLTKKVNTSSSDQYSSSLAFDSGQTMTVHVFYPASWLVRLGLKCGFRVQLADSRFSGRVASLATFNVVSDDASIFESCRQGNVSAVRNLLVQGNASIKDSDSCGQTPLHVSLSKARWRRSLVAKSRIADKAI